MHLCFEGSEPILEGFTDADMAEDLNSRKSTSGYLFTFVGEAISWQSKLKKYSLSNIGNLLSMNIISYFT